jgi:hypothetical protein
MQKANAKALFEPTDRFADGRRRQPQFSASASEAARRSRLHERVYRTELVHESS